MKDNSIAVFLKVFSFLFVVALVGISVTSSPAYAMFLPATSLKPDTFDRASDLAAIQKVLESKILQQRLTDYGLSPDKAIQKIDTLSSGQVHQYAAALDALHAGGHRSHMHGGIQGYWYGPFYPESVIILVLVMLIVLIP